MRMQSTALFEKGCRFGFIVACRNARGANIRAQPTLADYPILLRGSKGPIADRSAPHLYALACEQGWAGTCGRSDTER
jgi:hypothetical protein